jgi:hypothetical protein
MKKIICLILLVIFQCASIVKGGKQEVSIRLNQPDVADAKVSIYTAKSLSDQGALVASGAPTLLTKLKTGNGFFGGASYKVVVEAPGYQKKEVFLDTSLRWGWYVFGNFMFGGLIGLLIVDPATGAMWALDVEDDELKVSLESKTESTPTPAGKKKVLNTTPDVQDVKIVLLKDIPEKYRDKLVRVSN